jgi:adenylate kinase family enzyme
MLTTAYLYKNGRIQRVNQRFISKMGATTDGDKTFKSSGKKMKKTKIKSESSRAKHIQEVTSICRLSFVKKVKVQPHQRTNVLDHPTLEEKSLEQFSEMLGVDTEDLSMTEDTKNFALAAQKEQLEKETDFPLLLNQLASSPKNVSVFNKVLQYTKILTEKALPILVLEYKKVETAQNSFYQKTLHTLLAATQSPVAERILLEAMKQGKTTQSAMINIALVKRPLDETIHTLQALSEEKSLGVLSSQAYLMFAHMASKTENAKLAAHVVGKIIMNLNDVDESDAFAYHIRALFNAGEAVPLEVLERLINAEHLPLDSRIDATRALKHRISRESTETTELIHRILDSELHEEIKTAAVQAQTAREKVLETGESLIAFNQHIQSDSTHHTVLHALAEYYEEAAPTISLSKKKEMQVEQVLKVYHGIVSLKIPKDGLLSVQENTENG